MTMLRAVHNRENPYVVVTKPTINNKKLSLAARGLLVWLLDKPDDFAIEPERIAKSNDITGYEAKKLLTELSAAGYVLKPERRHINGRFRYTSYTLRETPDITVNRKTDDSISVNSISDSRKQFDCNSATVFDDLSRMGDKHESAAPQITNTNTKNKKQEQEQKTTTTLPAVNPEIPAPEAVKPGSSSVYIVPTLTEVDLWESAVHGEPASEDNQPPEARAVLPSKPEATGAIHRAPPPPPSPPNTVPIDLQDNALGRITTLYHENFGMLAPLITDAIKARLDECGEKWVADAIRETVFQGKRAWKYTDAILANWLLDGKQTLYATPAATPAPPPPVTPVYEFPVYDDLPDVPPVPDEPVDPLWQQLCRAVKNWSTPLFLDCMKKCQFGGFADGILSIIAPDDKCGARLNHQHFLEREAEAIWTDFRAVNFIVKGVTT